MLLFDNSLKVADLIRHILKASWPNILNLKKGSSYFGRFLEWYDYYCAMNLLMVFIEQQY